MSMFNNKEGYGAFTKLFHWIIVLLFAVQYVGAAIMTNIARKETVFSLSQGDFYDWHKSLGLVALLIAIVRLANRYKGQLPPWAPTLSKRERAFIHRDEQLLYLAMFLMPISGYLFVMAGGYGVLLFGVWKMPNPIGKIEWLALTAQWVHFLAGWALLVGILGHVFVVLRHQFVLKDNLLARMLPKSK